jgi:hypothetical protein
MVAIPNAKFRSFENQLSFELILNAEQFSRAFQLLPIWFLIVLLHTQTCCS